MSDYENNFYITCNGVEILLCNVDDHLSMPSIVDSWVIATRRYLKDQIYNEFNNYHRLDLEADKKKLLLLMKRKNVHKLKNFFRSFNITRLVDLTNLLIKTYECFENWSFCELGCDCNCDNIKCDCCEVEEYCFLSPKSIRDSKILFDKVNLSGIYTFIMNFEHEMPYLKKRTEYPYTPTESQDVINSLKIIAPYIKDEKQFNDCDKNYNNYFLYPVFKESVKSNVGIMFP